MTSPNEKSIDIPVHPTQLGVDEFSGYSLIIDARSPHEFAIDHLPGAVNLPVVDDIEFSEVGTRHAKAPHEAYLIGAEHALRNIARHVGTHIARYPPESRFLVYCFRGGKRSKVWADVLRTIGAETHVLPGGWKAYRHWVREGLERLPAFFEYRVLSGSTGCGKTRLLHALANAGEQVIDLEGLASHRGSLIGELPGIAQPTQKMFESMLLDKLRGFETGRPIWIEAESKKIGKIQFPTPLHEAMLAGTPINITASISDRVRLLKEDYPHWANDLVSMVDKLAPLRSLIGGNEMSLWRSLAEAREVDRLFERLMTAYYDPAYERSLKRSYRQTSAPEECLLASLDAFHVAVDAAALIHRFGTRRPYADPDKA